MTRSQKNTAIFFSVFMGLFSFIESLIQAGVIDEDSLLSALRRMLISGSISWLLFYLPARFFKTKSPWKQYLKIDLDDDELLVLQSFGTHLKGIEAVGGKLVLTNKRLIFKSHKINTQIHGLSINLDDIVHVARRKTAGLINNRLVVTSLNNQVNQFTVEEPAEWIEKLGKASIKRCSI